MNPSLLARCQSGDTRAWRQFYDLFADAVYRWSLGFGLDRSSAEEITQEVFITATKRIASCESDAQLPTWLFQTTRRHAANARRLRWVKRVVGWSGPTQLDAEPSSDAERHELRLELTYGVRRALRALPIRLAEVLVLHDLDGRTHEEIAAMLAIPPGTVASRLRAARALFEKAWNQ